MPLTKSSVLHYWSARFGPIPIIGGNPVHTRASTAKWVDQMGLVRQAPVNTPRFEWATIDGERRPIMRLELARTNAFSAAEDLSSASWSKNAVTVSADAALSATGELTADKIAEDAANSEHYVSRTVTATDNTVQAFSVDLRAGERTWAVISAVTKAGGVLKNYINLATGAKGTTDATTRVTPLGGDWYRVAVVFDAGAGGTTPAIRVGCSTGDGVASYAGSIGSGIYASRLQFEQDGIVESSYAGDNASRAAEQFYWAYPHAPQAMCVYCRFVEIGNSLLPDSGRIFQIGHSDNTTPRLLFFRTAGNLYRVIHATSGGSVATDAAAAPAIGDVVELVVDLQPDGKVNLYQSLNGGAVSSGVLSDALALGANWSDTRFWVNSRGANNIGLGAFAEFKAVKRGDLSGGTATAILEELRAFELAPSGEVAS